MPCRSDYMEPTGKEKRLQETAQFYAYVLHATGKTVPDKVNIAARDHYCRADFVADLCEILKNMDPKTSMRVIYNPYDKTARHLADWWEEHQAADCRQEEKERAAIVKQDRYEKIIMKLSDEEIDLLKEQWGVS